RDDLGEVGKHTSGRRPLHCEMPAPSCPVRAIFDPRGRSDTSLFVRFALKATLTSQDAIRRFVPRGGLSRSAGRVAKAATTCLRVRVGHHWPDTDTFSMTKNR